MVPNSYGYISAEDPTVVFRHRSHEELRFGHTLGFSARYGVSGERNWNGTGIAGIFWCNFFNRVQISASDISDIAGKHHAESHCPERLCIRSEESIFTDYRKKYDESVVRSFASLLPDKRSDEARLREMSQKETRSYLISHDHAEYLGSREFVRKYAPAGKVRELKNGDVLLTAAFEYPLFDYSLRCFLRPLFPFRVSVTQNPSGFGGTDSVEMIYDSDDRIRGTLDIEYLREEKLRGRPDFFLLVRKGSDRKLLENMLNVIRAWNKNEMGAEKSIPETDHRKNIIRWNLPGSGLSLEKILLLFRGLENVKMKKNTDFHLRIG